MEFTRVRAKNIELKRENDLQETTAYFARDVQ